MSSRPSSSENIVNQKYDRCLADLLVKTGVGFSVGVVASVILFRRRAWPVAFSTGIGTGIAWADCDRLFNPTRGPGMRVVTPASTPAESK
ncbi:DUF543-domain-containing protein [Gloeophyllum trabeum ATCC 11539]|uniref:MICOS complex subunit MIC10 n=1 Tax=Gloeophyllum trabeum (strain ATCC 11539 / FP-39264 / Madison 617) TaxID=670483 RepID=S7PSM1_GLOTA|nr:DUF543-domain-containing protein [Gloeophyllum trabeum ATCC 11539]EPQ50821.1 DUF543-domain-containing protein [Gloeophyllum trabeum ATCC 11539]